MIEDSHSQAYRKGAAVWADVQQVKRQWLND